MGTPMRDTADKVDLSACRLCVIRNRGSGKQDAEAAEDRDQHRDQSEVDGETRRQEYRRQS